MTTKTSNQVGGSSSTKNAMGSNSIPTAASGSNYSKHAAVNNPRPNTFRLTPKVYEYRRNNKLCFRCGEKYYPGHNCKAKQLNCIRGEEEAILPDEIEEVMEAICLSALSGSNQEVNAILVKGSTKNRVLTVLIDSRSTHSFIDEQAVSETGYVAEYSSPMKVTIADGNYVMCHMSCLGFSWKIGGKLFKENLRIIKLEGCDLVLGNDWMKKNNPTKFDYEKKLEYDSGNAMSKLIKKGQTLITHLFILGGEPKLEHERVDDAIHEVIDKYQVVFVEPKALPLVGQLDHAINLKPGASPDITTSYEGDSMAMELITQLTVDTTSPKLWQYLLGVLRRKGKVVSTVPLALDETNGGLLQPLPIPDQSWRHISLDFIEGLPKSSGKDAIFVVVDKFTKGAHFLALSHPFTALQVATKFWKRVHTLHGPPESIISDRDKIFLILPIILKQMGKLRELTGA
ncbi:hypothetical protein KY290_011930 [Solanum tuberosum]|uniref:Integrase catalytic domain-containing protein n=1 Tax=Solanum tuberosum TaxID=4113 RepID=A0ABQ7W412_SOLTU|nr:hypothetical protein KY289_012453 [Solanum tuberosum]KAH0710589.1 hypothetical protein KY284_012016 [Solanum tuberosum]KAH0774793.1 hypothetical protein KY290_011930 [Solanum tuberosum]